MPETPIHEDTQPFTAPVLPQPLRDQDFENRGTGCGCWVAAMTTLTLVIILVGVGLFLPPINLYDRLFAPQYAVLSAEANAVTEDGLTVIVNPADPGRDFGVLLSAFPMESIGSDNPESRQVAAALAAAPPNTALQSPIYRIQTTGQQPGEVTLNLALPPASGSTDLLDLYAWNERQGRWNFVPAQFNPNGTVTAVLETVPNELAVFQSAPQDQPTVLVSVDVTQILTPEVSQLATIVAPGGLQPTLDGRLTGSLAAGFDLNAGYLVMPVIRNFIDPRALDTETVNAILGNSTLRTAHVSEITSFVSNGGYDGVVIDYRDLSPEQRANFSSFIRQLGTSMDNLGLTLGVVIPAAENVDGTWETGAYDWREIGTGADLVQINFSLDPSIFAPGADRLVEAMMRWGVGEISRNKILLGITSQSVQQIGGNYTTVGFAEALAGLGDVQVEAQITEADTVEPGSEIRASLDGYDAVGGKEEAIQTTFIDYVDAAGTVVTRMWLTTADALRFRMDRTTPFALRGVAFEDLLAEQVADGVLQSVLNYKLQTPTTPSINELALRWRIEGVNGVISEITTGLNEELIATIEAPDGNYAINVEIVGGQENVPRGGAALSVFAPTPTPTPRPTATPEPTATPTPRPAPVQAPSSQVSSAPVANQAGGIVASGFEYGGHVTGTGTAHVGAMQRAGMNWMKIQLRYTPGMGPGEAAGPINEAHARGFKILLGIVGNPGDLAAGGEGYMQQYAQFVGGVAGLGPDAIEIWNEPNIDREWPRGQISGAMYTNLLRMSYQAIKSTNGGVMVISGAPAPTGAEAAFPGQVQNDNNWLRDVVNSGGLQYMDCVGAHYNEGIVSPTQRTGDPRDGYYTRYFGGMLDTYWSIVGGQKPICFTELGFLSSEGYGPLPDFFSWASGVSVAQQAAWLAEAAALSSQSGKVRLMIVWNVDFPNYGADPMAGYAMIRPGGGCPACDALAAAR